MQNHRTALWQDFDTTDKEVWQSWFDNLENLSYYALEDDLQKEDA